MALRRVIPLLRLYWYESDELRSLSCLHGLQPRVVRFRLPPNFPVPCKTGGMGIYLLSVGKCSYVHTLLSGCNSQRRNVIAATDSKQAISYAVGMVCKYADSLGYA